MAQAIGIVGCGTIGQALMRAASNDTYGLQHVAVHLVGPEFRAALSYHRRAATVMVHVSVADHDAVHVGYRAPQLLQSLFQVGQ